MSDPASFALVIYKAIEICEKKDYHILLIICDGAITNMDETRDAIINASKYHLSLICVRVGKEIFGIFNLYLFMT